MTSKSKKTFIVWMHNKTDRRDDEPIKLKAVDKNDARRIAIDNCDNRFTVGNVYTISEFSKATDWPHTWAKKLDQD